LFTTGPGVAEQRATCPVLDVAELEEMVSDVALPWKE
jgi:hypothetical protein